MVTVNVDGTATMDMDLNWQESRIDFQAVFETVPGRYIILGPGDFRIIAVSDAYLRSTMTHRADILGRSIFEVFPDAPGNPTSESTNVLRGSLHRVITHRRADAVAVQHYPIPRPEAMGGGFEERYWSPVNVPVLGPDNELKYIIHCVEDVTDLVRLKAREGNVKAAQVMLASRAETMAQDIVLRAQELQRLNDQLQESEQRFLELAENVQDVFFNFDPSHQRVLYVSPPYENVWGRPCAELYDNPWSILSTVHPADRVKARRNMLRSIRGIALTTEFRILFPNEEIRWILCHSYPVRNAEGRLEHVVGTASDITDRKEAELKLARSNRALRMISACNQASIKISDEATLLKKICQIAVDIGGYRMAWVGYAQDDAAKSLVPVANAGVEADYLSKLNLSWSEEPQGLGPGGIVIRTGKPMVLEDISLEDSFQPWLSLARQRGFRGLICLPLTNAAHTFGFLAFYSSEVRPVPPDELNLLQELAENLAHGISSIRSEQDRKRLHATVVKVAAAVSASTGMEFFQQLVVNMTDALGAQGGVIARVLPEAPGNALTLTVAEGGQVAPRYAYALASSPCNNLSDSDVWVEPMQLAENYPEFQPTAEPCQSYVGIRLVNSAGQHMGQLFVVFREPLLQSDFIVSTLKIFAARVAAELERQEADARIHEQASLLDQAHDAIVLRDMDHRILYWNKGAERLYGWVASEAVGESIEALLYEHIPDFHAAIEEVLEYGEWRGQVTQRHRDGHRLLIEGHWTLMRHKDGRPKSILVINTDISKRRAMEEQLQQAQRLKAVGELTGGVAHDFNNLLTVILGNTELLLEELVQLPQQDELIELTEMTRAAAQQGAAVIHRLLAFSSRQTLQPQAVDITALIGNMNGLLQQAVREDINIAVQHDEDRVIALADATQLESVLLNLCINARDAMDQGGMLTIHTAKVRLDQDTLAESANASPGRYVMIQVTDSGHGITAAALDRVYEPFFTTKTKGKGTGLGLSIVYGFIQQSKGHIEIRSQINQGTTVTMYLPAADRLADANEEPASEYELQGSERVLLVEDDELVRQHAERQLLALGYKVKTAADGEEALGVLRERTDIDLLFTDVVMPGGLSGPELVKSAKALRPTLKVLYTSGYTDNAVLKNGSLKQNVKLLNKPYRRLELARKVRSVLSGEEP